MGRHLVITSARKSLKMVIKTLINRISDVDWNKINLCLLAKTTDKDKACVSRTADEDDLQLVLSSWEPTIKEGIFLNNTFY